MTDEKPYSKREIDSLHDGIHEKLDTLITQARYTNGKVKRITLALVAIGFFSLGLGLVEAKTILALII